MFYVVLKGARLDVEDRASYPTLKEAMDQALKYKAENGVNYDVIKVESVWTTQTLAEVMAKRGIPRVIVTTDPPLE